MCQVCALSPRSHGLTGERDGPRSCTVKDRVRALCGNAGDDLLEDELFELGLER